MLSALIDGSSSFKLDLAHQVIIAEIGTEIQGSWVNLIGQGAARNVEEMILQQARRHRWLQKSHRTVLRAGRKRRRQLELFLRNGWRIIFSSEPDVAVYDSKGVLRAAVEIKGSMDKAGAQTRYGEAKKSFSKALRENPRCETFYLASCFTQAVLQQIKEDGQVRQVFNLADVLSNVSRRQEFLDELFTYVIRINSDG